MEGLSLFQGKTFYLFQSVEGTCKNTSPKLGDIGMLLTITQIWMICGGLKPSIP